MSVEQSRDEFAGQRGATFAGRRHRRSGDSYCAAAAEAQLNTQHIKGTVGLKSGSQAPPGVYFIAPLFYVYKTDEVKDRDGVRLPFAANLTSQVHGGGINVVTKRKLFGKLSSPSGVPFKPIKIR